MTRRNYSTHLTLIALTAALALTATPDTSRADPTTRVPIGARAAQAPRLALGRRPVTLDLRAGDGRSVLRRFSERSGVNIVPSPQVQGAVTLSFKRVPLQDAFVAVLESQGLTWERVGDVVVVSPR